MFLRKLLSDSLIYSIGPQIPKIASIFVLPIITQHLSATDYGIAGLIATYTGLLSGIGDLGFSIIMVNSFYKYPNKWQFIWRQYHFYLSIWSIIFAFLQALLLYCTIPKEARSNTFEIITLLTIPVVFFNITTTFATRYYQFARKPMFVSLVSAFVGVLAIFLNLYTIAYLKMAYMGWLYSSFICSMITFLCYLYPVYFKYKLFPIFKFRIKFLVNNLKISLPLIPHNYSSYLLNSSDRMVMDYSNIPTKNIGEYNLAYTFGGYMEFFGNAVGMAIGPTYNKLYSKKHRESDRFVYIITEWLQFSFILACFMVSLWSKELFDFLISNKQLKTVYPLAIIIIMGYAYRPYYWSAINRLQFNQKTDQLWKISFIAGLLNIILNLIFIPIYGIYAAATTTFFSLLYIGFSGYFLQVFKELETEKYYPKETMLTIILITCFVYLIKDVSVGHKLIISAFSMICYFGYILNRKNILQSIPA